VTETLDRNSAVPLYIQLGELIRGKITRGEWVPDQKIPSENEFNALFGISRMTSRQVLAKLVEEGLLFRVQGKGTFVAHQKISTRSPSYMGIREQLEQQGYATSTEILSARLVDADARVARELGIQEGTPVYAIRRLRKVEEAPISLHESFVPQALAPGITDHDLATQQLCTVLEHSYDLQMAKVTETLETDTASKADAKLFGNRAGMPLLLLEQRITSSSGVAFEFSRIHFRGDRIRLEFHYDL
jgi:GntR family transcriptional regulator